MKVSELDVLKNPPSILIYGPAGTFKTGLVSQASGAYLFDFDNGMATAKTMKDKFTSIRQNLEFDTYVDEDPRKAHAWMDARDKMQSFVNAVAAKTFPYNGIVIDSLTGMTKAIQYHTMKCVKNDPFAKPEIQHWYAMILEMEKVLSMIRGIKSLVIVTAHEMPLEKDGRDVFTPKSMTKKHSATEIKWLFDEIWHSSVSIGPRGVTQWMLSSVSTPSIECRTRRGFPDRLIYNEIGLKGVLEKIGYVYEEKKGD